MEPTEAERKLAQAIADWMAKKEKEKAALIAAGVERDKPETFGINRRGP